MNVYVVPVCLCVCVCVIHTSRSRGVSRRFFLLFFLFFLSFLFALEPQKRDAPFERSNVCRRELGRVLENRWHVVLEVRQRLRGSRQGCFEGTAFVQGTRVDVWSLASSSRRIQNHSFSSPARGLDLSLSRCAQKTHSLSLFLKRLELGTRCTLSRRNT